MILQGHLFSQTFTMAQPGTRAILMDWLLRHWQILGQLMGVGEDPPLENSYDLGTAPNLQGSRKPLVNQKVNPLPTVTGRGQNPKYDKEKITSSFNRR